MAYKFERDGKKFRCHNLLESISKGSLDAVQYFLNKGSDLNILDYGGYTPLAHAVRKGNLNIVKYLVDCGADVCKVGMNGESPLFIAAENQSLKMVRLLLDNGAKFNLPTAFLAAIETKNFEIVKYMTEKGAIVNFTYKNGYTPLTKAIETQSADVTKYLIDNGANAQAVIDDETNSYLIKCVTNQNLDMVKVLCEVGAKLDKLGKCRYKHNLQSAFLTAIETENVEIVKYMIENDANVEPIVNHKTNKYLMKCVKNKNLDMVMLLHDNGANVNRPGECGYTPLTKAAEIDNFAVVNYLVKHGAGVNFFDNNKKTALSIALSNSCFRIVSYLMDSGADTKLAKAEVEAVAKWNEDFVFYMKSLKLKPKYEETRHEESTK